MKKNIFNAFIVLLFTGFVVTSIAKEVLVPMDKEGKLKYIDSKIEQKLGLFSEYSNFQEARLFQTSDTTFVLEVFYQTQEALLKDRVPLSEEEVKDFRKKVTERIKQQAPQVVLNQEGRPEFLIGTLALSLGYYGWAVPLSLDVQDGKTVAALYMFTSAGSFFLPFWATREISVTNAAAILSSYCGTRGIAHGICLSNFFFGNESTFREIIACGLLVSITEATLGFHIASKSNMQPGKAEVIGVGGDFGFGMGFGAAHLANFSENDNRRAAFGSVLLGSGVGLMTGLWLGNQEHYTQGDANVLRAAGFLGAYVPLAVVDIASPENKKAFTSASMIGSAIGLGLGHSLVRRKNFTTGQGRLITFGEFAGGLFGLGCAYLFSSDEGNNSTLFLTSSSLGAIAGFWLMYRSFAKNAQTSEEGSSWNINIAPEGLAAIVLNKRNRTRATAPLLNFNLRF